MNGNLMVSKSLYSTGLNTTEMMLISQIKEFERNGSECFVTNQQFADWFGVSTKTIERTLDKLEENNYIKRETKTVNTNGKKSIAVYSPTEPRLAIQITLYAANVYSAVPSNADLLSYIFYKTKYVINAVAVFITVT